MQVYRGMEVLSSQPSPAQLKKVRHHLIGVIPPSEDFNVSRYRLRALAAVRDIIARRRLPLFVGGSGLYMSVVVDGIFKAGKVSPAIRRRLEAAARSRGSAYLHSRLLKADPAAAAKIHPNDARRIVRALEVFEATGKPISELQARRRGLSATHDVRMVCLDLPRDELYGRINRRVDAMFREGAVDEVKRLLKGKTGTTASCAIGLNEIKASLDGTASLEEAKELMKRNTRLYAKRQLTWFRKDKRIRWAHSQREAGRMVAAAARE
jgi:tRNA dimethylallyltransferase